MIKASNELAMMVDGEQYVVGKSHGDAPAPPAEQTRWQYLIQKWDEVVGGAHSLKLTKLLYSVGLAGRRFKLKGGIDQLRLFAATRSSPPATETCRKDLPHSAQNGARVKRVKFQKRMRLRPCSSHPKGVRTCVPSSP